MFIRKIFASPVSDSDNPEVPGIIITAPVQSEAAPQRGLRRTAAVSNLASLDDVPEAAVGAQFTSSTVTIAHSFAAASVTVTVSESRVERRDASSFLSMKKGYELEDPCIFIGHLLQQPSCFDDAEESSSEADFTPCNKLAVPAPVRRLSNSTDPDSLEKIWKGISSTK